MAVRVAELEAVLTLKDEGFNAGVDAANAKITQTAQTSQSAGQAMQTVGVGLAGIGAAAGAGLGMAVNAAADFEFSMDAVNAAMGGLDGSQFEAVEKQALSLGASTKFSAGEIAGVQEALGKAGISVETVLGGATDAVANLSAATGEDLVASGEAAAASINLFGLKGERVTGVADTLTAGLNSSSASLSDLRTGINNLGPVMTNLAMYAGKPEEAFSDTTAAVAYFNAQGLKAADAGVSLARGMTNLADPTSDASALMKELGISAFDANGNFLPLPDLMDSLSQGMSGMSDQAREAALATIFGAEAADVMNIAIKNGGDGLRDYEAKMVSSGQAAEQAALRQTNLKSAMEALGGSIETAAIALGQAFIGPLTAAARGIGELVNIFIALPKPVQTAVAGLTALVAVVGTGLGGAILIVPKIVEFKKALDTIGAGAKVAEAGMRLLGLSLGPVGIALGVLALGVVAYQTNFLGFRDAVNALADALGPHLQAAADAAGRAFQFLADAAGQALGWIVDRAGEFGAWVDQFDVFASIADAAGRAMAWLQEQSTNLQAALNSLEMPQALQDLGDWLQDNIGDRLLDAAEMIEDFQDALSDIDLPPALESVADWFTTDFAPAVQRGIDKINELNRELAKNAAFATSPGDPTSIADVPSGADWRQVLADRANGVAEVTDATNALGQSISAVVHADEEWAASTGAVTQAMAATSAEAEGMTDAQIEAMEELTNAYRDALAGGVNPFMGGLRSATTAADDFFAVMQLLPDLGFAEISDSAQHLLDVTQGFVQARADVDGLLQSFQQLQSLAASMTAAEQLVTGLVGVRGEVSALDGLLASHLITWKEYEAAQVAQEQIARDTAIAQNLLNAEIAKQAPALADAVNQQGLYLQNLLQLPEGQREVALAMMDTATQAKVAAAFSTAYSASLGEIPEVAATQIIANAAGADATLAMILEEYGLIEQGADGIITVTLPDPTQDALARFREMFVGSRVFTANGFIYVETGAGTTAVYDQFNNLVELDGSVITATVDIQMKDAMNAEIVTGAGGGNSPLDGMGQQLADRVESSVASADFRAVGTAVETKLGAEVSSVDVSADAATLATNVTGQISEGVVADAATVQVSVQSIVTEALAGTDPSSDAAALATQLTGSLSTGITDDQAAVTLAIESVVGAAITAGDTRAQTANTVGTTLTSKVGEGITAGAQGVEDQLVTATNDAITNANNAAQAANQVGTSLVTKIRDEIVSTGAEISSQLATAIGDAITNATTKAEEARNAGLAIITNLRAGVTDNADTLSTDLSTTVSSAITALESVAASARQVGANIGTAIVEGISSAVQAGMGQVAAQIQASIAGLSANITIPVNVNTTVNGTTSYDAGAESGSDFVHGLTDAASAGNAPVQEAGGQLAGSLLAGVDSVGGIHSPSTEMIWRGEMMTEGFIIGVLNGVPGLYDAAEQMIAPLSDLELDLALLASQSGEVYLREFANTLRNGSDWIMDASGAVVDQFGNALAEDFTSVVAEKGDMYTGFGEQLGAMVTEGMIAGGSGAEEAGIAAGTAYTTGIGLAMVEGVLHVTDAAGQLIRPLTDLEVSLVKEATYAGEQFVNSLITVLASGAELAVDATGQITDGIGNVLASDFTLIEEQMLVDGYGLVSAMANGMVGATPQIVGASVYVADQAMGPFIEMSTRAYDAATDSVIDAAGGMLATGSVLTDAAATVTGGVTAEFAQMYNDIVAIVNGILEQAGVAASAASSISVSSGSGSSEDTGRIRVNDRGGRSSGRNANASGGSVRHGNIDGNADVDIDVSGGRAVDRSGRGSNGRGGGRGGDTYHVTNNNYYRDERQADRHNRRRSRQRDLTRSRGV